MRVYQLSNPIIIKIPLLENLDMTQDYILASAQVDDDLNNNKGNYFCVGGVHEQNLTKVSDIICQQFWTCRNLYPKIKYFRGLILLKKIIKES